MVGFEAVLFQSIKIVSHKIGKAVGWDFISKYTVCFSAVADRNESTRIPAGEGVNQETW